MTADCFSFSWGVQESLNSRLITKRMQCQQHLGKNVFHFLFIISHGSPYKSIPIAWAGAV